MLRLQLRCHDALQLYEDHIINYSKLFKDYDAPLPFLITSVFSPEVGSVAFLYVS